MKINGRDPLSSRLTGRKDSSGVAKSGTSGLFSTLLGNEEAQLDQENILDSLGTQLSELEDLGKELLLRRSLGSLDKYKSKLAQIMAELSRHTHVGGTVVSERGDGRFRHLQLSRQVDEGLIQIQKSVMEGEKGNLTLAASIDNIKGLLLDFTR